MITTAAFNCGNNENEDSKENNLGKQKKKIIKEYLSYN